METVIANNKTKEKCQIFTPDNIVKTMLDLSGYGNNVFGKKVLENSCGDGQILAVIVRRYIEDCKKQRFSFAKIKKGLEKDITAFEIDCELVDKCKIRLSKIAAEYSILNVNWNIRKNDFITSTCEERFDYIIGNPPYIAYPDLPQAVRRYVRENFLTCKKGKFDYSYAFIEKSYNLLSDNGTLVYIIPSNMFKNVFASSLRNLIEDDLTHIYDFPNDQVFSKALVSPAVIKVRKNSCQETVHYTRNMGDKQTQSIINKDSFVDKWIFDVKKTNTGCRVGDHFRVSSAMATLLNEAFVVKDCLFDDNFCYIGNEKIEKSILRRAASPKNKKYKKHDEYIIFPYYFDSKGKIKHYSEKQMIEKFPCAVSYLSKFKEQLLNRKADKTAKWYEYGRSQALQNANQKMILLSSIISECTKAYLLDEDEVPYSGLYIIPKGEKKLEEILEKLNSQEFTDHIFKVGVCVSGQSKRITPADVEDFIYNYDEEGKNE